MEYADTQEGDSDADEDLFECSSVTGTGWSSPMSCDDSESETDLGSDDDTGDSRRFRLFLAFNDIRVHGDAAREAGPPQCILLTPVDTDQDPDEEDSFRFFLKKTDKFEWEYTWESCPARAHNLEVAVFLGDLMMWCNETDVDKMLETVEVPERDMSFTYVDWLGHAIEVRRMCSPR